MSASVRIRSRAPELKEAPKDGREVRHRDHVMDPEPSVLGKDINISPFPPLPVLLSFKDG